MTDNEAYKLIGERAEELTSNTEIKMFRRMFCLSP